MLPGDASPGDTAREDPVFDRLSLPCRPHTPAGREIALKRCDQRTDLDDAPRAVGACARERVKKVRKTVLAIVRAECAHHRTLNFPLFASFSDAFSAV